MRQKPAAGHLDTAGKAAQDSADKAEKGESAWSKLGDVLAAAAKAAATAAAAAGAAAIAAGSALVGASVVRGQICGWTFSLRPHRPVLQPTNFKSTNMPLNWWTFSTETLTKSMAKNIKSMASAKKGHRRNGGGLQKARGQRHRCKR